MSAECGTIRELVPEVALGVAGGEERARVLEHLGRCAACREELDGLSALADELLVLAPPAEPPAGFEARTLARLAPRSPRHGALRVALAAAAGAALAAALTAAVLLASGSDDRRVAADHRATLAEANGEYFEAGRLRDGRGRPVGQAFGYEGKPSWVTVVLSSPVPPGVYTLELVGKKGGSVRLGTLRLGRARVAAGRVVPVSFDSVRGVRLVGPGRGNVLAAELHER
jgi:hypothetical protein